MNTQQKPLGVDLSDSQWADQRAMQAAPMDPGEMDARVIECRGEGLNKSQAIGPCLRLVEYKAHKATDSNGKESTVVDQVGVGSDDVAGFDAAWNRAEAREKEAQAVNPLDFDTKAKYVAALNKIGVDGVAWAAALLSGHGVTTWGNLKKELSVNV